MSYDTLPLQSSDALWCYIAERVKWIAPVKSQQGQISQLLENLIKDKFPKTNAL